VAGVERKFAQRNALRGMDVGILHTTHHPARRGQQLVDVDTCVGFSRHAYENVNRFDYAM